MSWESYQLKVDFVRNSRYYSKLLLPLDQKCILRTLLTEPSILIAESGTIIVLLHPLKIKGTSLPQTGVYS